MTYLAKRYINNTYLKSNFLNYNLGIYRIYLWEFSQIKNHILKLNNLREIEKFHTKWEIREEEYGYLRGKEEGEAIGEARGKEEKQLEMIKSMLKEGLSIKTISKVSKLSEDEIEKLIK